MTRLAYSADWHIDSYGQRVDPETGLSARLTDYLRTATWVAEEAQRRGCEALVVAGDLSESRHPSPWLVARIRECLAAGPERVIVTRGNHDGARGGRSIVDLIDAYPGWDGVDRPRVVRVGDVAICCIGHMDRHWLRAQPGFEALADAEVFRVLAEQYLAIARGLYAEAMDGGAKAAILIGHQTLSGGAMSESQQAFLGDLSLVVDGAALAAIGYSLVAFGHLHRAQTVIDDPACPVVYAGSIERVDFGEQDEQKSFLVVDVEPGRPVRLERIPTPARRFVTVDYAAPAEDLGTLIMGGIEDAIVRAINVPPDVPTDDVVKGLELAGAFDVTEVRHARVETPESTGGLSESLTAHEALAAYLADDPDAEALMELGRSILAEVQA